MQCKVPGTTARSLLPRDSGVVLKESPHHRGPTYKSVSSDIVLKNCPGRAFCRHSMIITIMMRVNRDDVAKELFGYESDNTRNLLICMYCLR